MSYMPHIKVGNMVLISNELLRRPYDCDRYKLTRFKLYKVVKIEGSWAYVVHDNEELAPIDKHWLTVFKQGAKYKRNLPEWW